MRDHAHAEPERGLGLHPHRRRGAVRLEGREGARWVAVGELLLCEVQEHDSGLGAWVGVRPGHALEQIGLLESAPVPSLLTA